MREQSWCEDGTQSYKYSITLRMTFYKIPLAVPGADPTWEGMDMSLKKLNVRYYQSLCEAGGDKKCWLRV